jgi:hypothetical protein
VAGLIGAELPRRLSGVHLPVGARSTPLPGGAPGSSPSVPAVRRGNPGIIYALIALLAGGVVVGAVIFLKPQKSQTADTTAATAPTFALQVVTEPPLADVIIDGEKQSLKTPNVYNVRRAAALTLRVEKTDYAPYTETIKPAAGENARAVEIALKSLKAPTGSLDARVIGPKKATWTLDGKPAGDGSPMLHLGAIAAGKHTLKVEAPGFQVRDESIEVEARQARSVEWVLQAAARGSHKSKPSTPSTSKPGPDEPGAEWPPR